MVESHLQNQHETTPHFPKASGNGLIACLDWWFSILGILFYERDGYFGVSLESQTTTPPQKKTVYHYKFCKYIVEKFHPPKRKRHHLEILPRDPGMVP